MNELDKLEAYLKEHGYKYERIEKDASKFECEQHQIIIYDENDERQWDAVCAPATYGYEAGLLEVMGEKVVRVQDSVEGWLTADEVIKRLEEENNGAK